MIEYGYNLESFEEEEEDINDTGNYYWYWLHYVETGYL